MKNYMSQRAINSLEDVFIACLHIGSRIDNTTSSGLLVLVDVTREYGSTMRSIDFQNAEADQIRSKLKACIGILLNKMWEEKDLNSIDNFVADILRADTSNSVSKNDFKNILGI